MPLDDTKTVTARQEVRDRIDTILKDVARAEKYAANLDEEAKEVRGRAELGKALALDYERLLGTP